MLAKFGIERELEKNVRIIDYHNGNGDFHFHSQIEICFVTDGEIEAFVNNNRKCLKKGEISIALSYDTHVYKPVVDSKFSVLILPADLCQDFISYVNGKKIANPFIASSVLADKIISCFNEIRNNEANILVTKGNIYIILGLIAQNVVFSDIVSRAELDIISRLLLYIHEKFADNISLSSISAHFGYNPSYISYLFKSSLHIGITRYINILRLKNSISLLKSGNNNVSFCALESGFNSLRTFYRAFSQEFGCSPKSYIKKKNHET